jgi:hypothetical protein
VLPNLQARNMSPVVRRMGKLIFIQFVGEQSESIRYHGTVLTPSPCCAALHLLACFWALIHTKLPSELLEHECVPRASVTTLAIDSWSHSTIPSLHDFV